MAIYRSVSESEKVRSLPRIMDWSLHRFTRSLIKNQCYQDKPGYGERGLGTSQDGQHVGGGSPRRQKPSQGASTAGTARATSRIRPQSAASPTGSRSLWRRYRRATPPGRGKNTARGQGDEGRAGCGSRGGRASATATIGWRPCRRVSSAPPRCTEGSSRSCTAPRFCTGGISLAPGRGPRPCRSVACKGHKG